MKLPFINEIYLPYRWRFLDYILPLIKPSILIGLLMALLHYCIRLTLLEYLPPIDDVIFNFVIGFFGIATYMGLINEVHKQVSDKRMRVIGARERYLDEKDKLKKEDSKNRDQTALKKAEKEFITIAQMRVSSMIHAQLFLLAAVIMVSVTMIDYGSNLSGCATVFSIGFLMTVFRTGCTLMDDVLGGNKCYQEVPYELLKKLKEQVEVAERRTYLSTSEG